MVCTQTIAGQRNTSTAFIFHAADIQHREGKVLWPLNATWPKPALGAAQIRDKTIDWVVVAKGGVERGRRRRSVTFPHRHVRPVDGVAKPDADALARRHPHFAGWLHRC